LLGLILATGIIQAASLEEDRSGIIQAASPVEERSDDLAIEDRAGSYKAEIKNNMGMRARGTVFFRPDFSREKFTVDSKKTVSVDIPFGDFVKAISAETNRFPCIPYVYNREWTTTNKVYHT
jgi:hypothetical protein